MKKKGIIWIGVAAGIALCVAVLFLGKGVKTEVPQSEGLNKDPELYTWEEYQAMSLEDQDVFFGRFDSEESFEDWMESAKPEESTILIEEWDESEKMPNEYTWEEYLALYPEEQEAFFQWFDSVEEFEAWKEAVKPEETAPPAAVVETSERNPFEYTWEEYQAMSAREQDAFLQRFESIEAFEVWLGLVKPEETTEPILTWDPAGKQPNEYTWEEYQALTPEYQDAFFRWFGSEAAFEQWMQNAQPAPTTAPVQEWDKPGKLPNEYTWEEYQQLTPEEQDRFFRWFNSLEAFEAWMQAVKPAETVAPVIDWANAEKQPDEYTWDEYQRLSPEEQDAFFRWFASTEAFEAWMTAAMGA